MTDLGTLSHDRFEACREQEFVLAGDGAPVLRLAQVTVRDAVPGANASRQPFALLFHGPAEPALAQGTYTLRNATLGELAIFIVPVGREGGTALYEAVFN